MTATVDFTKAGWTLVNDTGVVITPTAITVDNQPANAECCFYKDYGLDFWSGDATFLFEFTMRDGITSGSENELGVMCAITNKIGSYNSIVNAAGGGDAGAIAAWTDFGAVADAYNMLVEGMPSAGPVTTSPATAHATGTKYYCTLDWNGTTNTATLTTYSDSARTSQVATATRVATSDPGSLRYLVMFATRGSAGGPNYLTIENLDDGVSDDFAATTGGGAARNRSRSRARASEV